MIGDSENDVKAGENAGCANNFKIDNTFSLIEVIDKIC